MSVKDKLLAPLNDTTSETDLNPESGIEPDPLEEYEPVEPPEIVQDFGEIEPDMPVHEAGHVSQGADSAGQSGTKQDRGILSRTDKLHEYGFFTSEDFYNDINPVEYLIDNIIQREAYHMVFGPSEHGKSFVVLDMAEHIAYSGQNPEFNQWFNKPVEHGDVIYFVGEGSNGTKKRHRLWCQLHKVNPNDMRIFFRPVPFALDEKDMAKKIIKIVKELSLNPALIVFDTLNRYMSGDENSNTDAAVFNAACSKLNSELNTAVMVLHHSGKGEETKKQSRGASAFRGALDIEFYVTKNEANVIRLEQTKNKDNEKEKPLLFNLKQYPIRGVDDNGNTKVASGKPVLLRDKYGTPVTSCVIYPAEELMKSRETAKAERKAEAKKPKLTTAQQFAYTSYYEAAAKHGEIVVDDETTEHTTIWLDVEEWRKVFNDKSSINNEDKEKEKDAKRKAFNRAREFFTKAKDLTKPDIATIKRKDGKEFYCLDLSNETIPASYRSAIRAAIEQRQQSEPQNDAKPDSQTLEAASQKESATEPLPASNITCQELEQADGSIVRVYRHKGAFIENGYPKDAFTAEHISPTGERTQLTAKPMPAGHFDPCVGYAEATTQDWLKRAKARQAASGGGNSM